MRRNLIQNFTEKCRKNPPTGCMVTQLTAHKEPIALGRQTVDNNTL